MSNETPESVTSADAQPVDDSFYAAPASGGNLPLAVGLGLVAAIAGAALWAVVTVVTEYQIGWMAVGVGCLVGLTVGKLGGGASAKLLGITGALLSLLGCLLGNFFSLLGFFSVQEGVSFFEVLNLVDFAVVPEVMIETASPMDFLFYAIAIYEGYKFGARGGV